MVGLLVKLLVCPIVVFLSALLFRDVYYPSLYQPIFVGLILAIVSHLMDLFMLKRGTFWLTLILDFLIASFLLYISAFFFIGAQITWVGAFLTGFILAITEYFQHGWLLQTNQIIKSSDR